MKTLFLEKCLEIYLMFVLLEQVSAVCYFVNCNKINTINIIYIAVNF